MTNVDVRNDREAVTARRTRILRMLAQGVRICDIAEALRLHRRTVERHREHHRAGRPCGYPRR